MKKRKFNVILTKIKMKNLIGLTLAGVINSVGVTMFLAPVDLYDSGFSGTSILLSQLTPSFLTLSLFLIVLNVPLFLFGIKKEGIIFTIYALYSVFIYSLFAFLIIYVFPVDVSVVSPLAGDDLLLCAIFGGVISGIGSGLAIRFGGAIDGIDVLAVIFAKKLNLSVGSFVMIFNLFLYIVSGVVLNSWILPLYSIVAYVSGLKTIDYIVDGIDRSKSAIIISNKADAVCRELSSTLGVGITVIDAKGYYSNTTKQIVYIVINRFQVSKTKNIVHETDPRAYITISEVSDIFKSVKRSEKKS